MYALKFETKNMCIDNKFEVKKKLGDGH